MTNNKISCNLIKDLLPNYIEKLTSEESNIEIRAHLETCDNCANTYQRMIRKEDSMEQIPNDIEKQSVNFLKKIKIGSEIY